MDQILEAIKTNDLIKAKKAFNSVMQERLKDLIEAKKVEFAKSIMIEGEESKEDDEPDEDDENDDEPEEDEEDK